MNILEARRRTLGKGVYKKTVEGNPAIAQGSLARMYPGITMQGWTEQNRYEGKNLLPVDVGRRFTGADVRDSAVFAEDGVTVSYNDIQIGTRKDIYMFGDGVNLHSESSYVDVPEITPGRYHICNDSARISFFVVVWRNGTSVLLGFSTTSAAPITIEEGDKFRIFFSCSNPGDGVQEYTIHPMLVKDGGELTTYEPYTGGQPSPNPDYPQKIVSAGKYNEDTQKWEYEVSVGGVQLFDISKVITEEGVVINNGDGTLTVKTAVDSNGVVAKSPHRLRDYCPDIVSGKTYYLYADSTGSEKIIYFSKSMFVWDFGSSRIITDDDLDSVVYFYASGLSTEATVSNIMITEVSNAPYEQYKPPQTVTLTSDRPLTKWDRLEKRNGQWGWVYKSGVKQLISDMNIIKNVEGTYQVPNFAKVDRNRRAESLSTHFIYKLLTTEYGNFWFDSAGTDLRFRTSQFQTAEEVKDWIQENKVYFAFPNAEETFVPLSETEQEQMNALYTFRPTTVLSNDCECEMTLTYKTKKSLEVTT